MRLVKKLLFLCIIFTSMVLATENENKKEPLSHRHQVSKILQNFEKNFENDVKNISEKILSDLGDLDAVVISKNDLFRGARRAYGLGVLTGLLIASAYSNYSKIKSYFSRTK